MSGNYNRPPSNPPNLDVPYYTDPRDFAYRRGDDIPFTSPEDYQSWSHGGQYSREDYHRPALVQQRYDAYAPDYRNQPDPSPSPYYTAPQHAAPSYVPPWRRRATPPRSSSPFHDPNPSYRQFSSNAAGPSRQPQFSRRSPSYAEMDESRIRPDTDPASYPASPRSRSPFRHRKDQPAYVPSLPPAEYLELSKPVKVSTDTSNHVTPKLLVLDLNGALIYRSKNGSGGRRPVYPRPYLCNFLEYLFGPQATSPITDDDIPKRPWEVFVWSSAQPHNVQDMVERGFGRKWIEGVYEPEYHSLREERLQKGEGRLLGVWARDKMNLSDGDYRRKVQTFKDLRKVIDHLARPEEGSQRPPMEYDEKRILLLDDSPLKAVNQPWNQLVVPEYDHSEWQQAKDAVKSDNLQDSNIDRYLLAVIGILEELKRVENVPAWVRAGGLLAGKADVDVRISQLSCDAEREVTLEDLPSHESFLHWHTVPEVVAHWVDRGIKTLQERGIELDHGMDEYGRNRFTDHSVMPVSPLPHSRPVERASSVESELDPDQFSVRRRVRAWTPSAPTMDETAEASFEESRRAANTSAPYHQTVDVSGRREMHTDARVPGANEAELILSQNGFNPVVALPQSGIPSRNGGDLRSVSRPADFRTDSWRTFRAVDVSAYLLDVADRISLDSSNQQDLQNLRSAALFLSTLAPEPEPTRPTEGWTEGMCWSCTLREGEAEGKRISQAKTSIVAGETKQQSNGRKNGGGAGQGKGKAKPKTAGKQKGKKKSAKGASARATQGAKAKPGPSGKTVTVAVHKGFEKIPLTDKDVKKHTGGWTPTTTQIDTVISKLDAQSERERGYNVWGKKKAALPVHKPDDMSDSMWRNFRSVLNDTGVPQPEDVVKRKKCDLARKRKLVHLAMFRESQGQPSVGVKEEL